MTLRAAGGLIASGLSERSGLPETLGLPPANLKLAVDPDLTDPLDSLLVRSSFGSATDLVSEPSSLDSIVTSTTISFLVS